MNLDIASYRSTLQRFKFATVDSVPGVIHIDSGIPGPILGISACTHGNEPAGLVVFDTLLHTYKIRETLTCGSVYLVVSNLDAAIRYYDELEHNLSLPEDQRLFGLSQNRYIDIDMNRLPENVMTSKDISSEIRRVQALRDIWSRFTIGFDIHSTLNPSMPMLISRGNHLPVDLIRGFTTEILLSNIDSAQINVPAFSFYGAQERGYGAQERGIPVLAIEAGQHGTADGFDTAIACTIALLQNLEMIVGIPDVTIETFREFYIEDSIIFPNADWDFVADFQHEEVITEGQLLAKETHGAGEIRAPFDGHLIMPSPLRGDKKKTEMISGAGFISRPVRLRIMKNLI